jgi:hypothetical protein
MIAAMLVFMTEQAQRNKERRLFYNLKTIHQTPKKHSPCTVASIPLGEREGDGFIVRSRVNRSKEMNLRVFCMMLLIFLSNTCYAQAAYNPPPKSAKDIMGCWERIDLSEKAKKQMNEQEHWPMRYQWFCFEPDGTLQSYMSNRSEKLTSAQLREMFKQIPKVFVYSVLPNGIIKTEDRAGREILHWSAGFLGNNMLIDQQVLEKGTLMMALSNPEQNKAVYWRFLKRVP